jgi:hypothetical protein
MHQQLPRRFPRVRSERPVLVRLLDEEQPLEELARTRVIGLGGCMFLSPSSLGDSAEVEILIAVDGAVVRTGGRVAYEISRGNEYEVGVEFLRVSPSDVGRLSDLVRQGPETDH